jgi:hypothetical protein
MDVLERYPQVVKIDQAPPRTNADDLELLKKLHKRYKKLVDTTIVSSAVKRLEPLDLLVKDEAELALILNYRLDNYNRSINRVKGLYGKLFKS